MRVSKVGHRESSQRSWISQTYRMAGSKLSSPTVEIRRIFVLTVSAKRFLLPSARLAPSGRVFLAIKASQVTIG